MTIDELSLEYEKQYRILKAKMEGLKPLLYIYTGKELYNLRKRLKVYEDMALECKATYKILNSYYDEEEND